MKHSILLLSAIVLIELAAPSYAVDVPSDIRAYTVSTVEPNWWGLARRGMRGRVVAQMTIDPKTGEVTQVQLLRKTVFAELNAEIVLTCFKWKFKPHTITSAKVPFELIVSGFVRQVH
jgi:TonB family protein